MELHGDVNMMSEEETRWTLKNGPVVSHDSTKPVLVWMAIVGGDRYNYRFLRVLPHFRPELDWVLIEAKFVEVAYKGVRLFTNHAGQPVEKWLAADRFRFATKPQYTH